MNRKEYKIELPPLTRKIVQERITEGFTAAHVTLMSIIQGVAFATLMLDPLDERG